MSSRTLFAMLGLAAFGLAASAGGFAEITIREIDILDANDPGGPAPAGLVVVDVAVELSSQDAFREGGFVGRTYNGARLVYRPISDPNDVPFLPPGPAYRFTTFGSAPYGRDDPRRYSPAGTGQEPTIACSTAYESGSPQEILWPDLIDVFYFPTPPDQVLGRSGYLLRVALDVTAVTIPGAEDPSQFRVFPLDSVPSGYLPVFLSEETQRHRGGIRVFGRPEAGGSVSARDWGVFVPEPNFLGLVLVALTASARRTLRR